MIAAGGRRGMGGGGRYDKLVAEKLESNGEAGKLVVSPKSPLYRVPLLERAL